MTVGVITNAFKEERWIEGCIKQFKDFELPHVVLNSLVPWGFSDYDFEFGKDNTAEKARKAGAVVYQLPWANEQDQFNTGLQLLGNRDWVLIVDADERYEKVEIEKLLIILEEIKDTNIEIVRPRSWSVYWKTPYFKLFPEQPYKPIIAIKPTCLFKSMRNAIGTQTFSNIEMHHFSYVRSDEEMKRKIDTFSHKDEIVPGWYNNKWLRWKPSMMNLHPVVPEQFQRAMYDPCPESIMEFLPHGN